MDCGTEEELTPHFWLCCPVSVWSANLFLSYCSREKSMRRRSCDLVCQRPPSFQEVQRWISPSPHPCVSSCLPRSRFIGGYLQVCWRQLPCGMQRNTHQRTVAQGQLLEATKETKGASQVATNRKIP